MPKEKWRPRNTAEEEGQRSGILIDRTLQESQTEKGTNSRVDCKTPVAPCLYDCPVAR